MPPNAAPEPETEFRGDIPGDLACGFCKKPIAGEFYRAANRFTCTRCAAQVQNLIDRNTFALQPFARAAGAGLAAALACAAGWAVIVHVTHLEIGIVAALIGYVVGKVVFLASGKRRGLAMQALAVGLSVIGIIGGKLALVGWQLLGYIKTHGRPIQPLEVARVTISFSIKNPSAVFSGFDLLWVGFAVYVAWRLCKAPSISIAGPYPHDGPGTPGLQFHTVEPAAPPPEPEQP